MSKIIDLHKFRSPGVGVFAGRRRGQYVRQALGINAGDQVILVVPEDVYSLTAGFPDELLRDTIIERIIGPDDAAQAIFDTLDSRNVPYRRPSAE